MRPFEDIHDFDVALNEKEFDINPIRGGSMMEFTGFADINVNFIFESPV